MPPRPPTSRSGSGSSASWTSTFVGRSPGPDPCDVGVDRVQGTPAPWTATEGLAEVDLDRGRVEFSVRGLVVAGDPTFADLGTTTVVTMVKGTLVQQYGAGVPSWWIRTPSR